MTTLLLRGSRALLGDTFEFDGQPRDVLIEGDRIKAVAPAGTLSAERVVDLAGHLLVPGLINGHFHSHEHFQKGRTENLPLEIWMQYVRTPVPVALTPRQTYLRTLIGAIEALRSGTTMVMDDLTLGPRINRENIDAVFQAYEDIGLRALVGFAMMNRPIVDNFPFTEEIFPAEMLQRLRQIRPPAEADFLGLCRDLARTHHPRTRRVGVTVSVSAPQRCTDDFLLACRRLADELDLAVVTHAHASQLQVVTGNVFYGGKTIIEHIAAIGFLSPRTSLIHAVFLNPRDVARLAESGATVQHNPWSNMMLGAGCQPVRALLDAGVNVTLGSDGTCSTVTANMLTTLGSAAALSKIRGDDYSRWLSAREVLHAATLAGARAYGFRSELGAIKPGAIADVVAYRLDSIAFTPLNDPVRQLVYAERGAGIACSVVAGQVVMENGKLTLLDEAKILAEIAAEYETLRAQFDQTEQGSAAPMIEAMERMYRRSLATAIAPDTYPTRFPE
jgi:guanine deaminase